MPVNTTQARRDFSDARHLAHLMRLGILPTGYICARARRRHARPAAQPQAARAPAQPPLRTASAVLHTGVLGELDHEVRQVDVSLATGWGLEADLEVRDQERPSGAQKSLSWVTAGIAALAHQPQAGESDHAATRSRRQFS